MSTSSGGDIKRSAGVSTTNIFSQLMPTWKKQKIRGKLEKAGNSQTKIFLFSANLSIRFALCTHELDTALPHESKANLRASEVETF